MKNNFMRLSLLFIILLLFLQTRLLAQEAIRLQYGVNDRFVLPLNATYLLPAFADGTIFLRDGSRIILRLNYNVARDEMHFINEKEDTIVIADPPTIAYIAINHDRFFYDKDRWLQAIETKAGITLAFRQVVKIQILNTLPYSKQINQSDGITEPGYFTGNGQKVKLDEGRYGIIHTTVYYYFGDKYGNFTKAGKVHLLRYFKKQQVVREFINSHHTNFDKLDDLLALLQFCDKLQKK